MANTSGSVVGGRDKGEKARRTVKEQQQEDLAKVQNGGYTVAPSGAVIDNETGPTANQQFAENNINYLNPDTANPVIDPFAAATGEQQIADQSMAINRRLAQQSLAEVQGTGLDAYTVNPTFYQPMSWDPGQQYQYETAEQQGRTDEMGLDAQRAALGGYRDIYSQGGLTAIDRAAMMESQAMREQQLRANREAIMANAAEQGRGSGVLSFLTQQRAAQGTANQRAMDDARMQAMALGRKDHALAGMGMVGNQMQTAQDAIDRFNTGNRQDVQQRNAEQANRGVDTKYADEQDVSRGNTDLANKFEFANKGTDYGIRAKQKDIQDARGDIANANVNVANQAKGVQERIAQEKQQRIANTWGAVGTIAGIAGQGVKKIGGWGAE